MANPKTCHSDDRYLCTMNVGIEIGIQDKLQSEQKQKDFHFISLLYNLDRSTLVDSETSFG